MLYQLSYIRKADYSSGLVANAALELRQICPKVSGEPLSGLNLFDVANHEVDCTAGYLQRCSISFDPSLDIDEIGERNRVLVWSEGTAVDAHHPPIGQDRHSVVAKVFATDQALDLFTLVEGHRGGDDCGAGALLRRAGKALGMHLEPMRVGGTARAV